MSAPTLRIQAVFSRGAGVPVDVYQSYIYSPVGAAIATPASQLQCPLAKINIFGHCNCDAGVAIAVPENIFFFIKIENFAQNHFIFLKKLKRPKNLSYQKEQNLVFANLFLNLFNFLKITLCFSQI